MSLKRVGPSPSALARFEKLLKDRTVSIGGLPTIAVQSFFATASSLTREAVLWLARGPEERDALASLASFWLSEHDEEEERFALLPFSDATLATPAFPPFLVSLARKEPSWVIATIDDLRLPLPQPSLLLKQCKEFRVGDTMKPVDLAETLVGLGYEEGVRVAERGSFARRGGIVDLWPWGGEPLRIDILDDSVETLASFNWKTQKTRERLQTVTLLPLKLPKANQSTILAYFEALGESVRVLMPDSEELLSLAPEAEKQLAHLEHFRTVMFMPFADEPAFDYRAAPLFHRDFAKLALELKPKKAWTTAFFTKRQYELKERLGAAWEPRLFDAAGAPHALIGFASERDRTLVLTDWELFGQEEGGNGNGNGKEHRGERADIVFLAELAPGDYVVHRDHGIGRFKGMTTNEVAGDKREYFVLTYAEDDKLFVPVELADKLSKYIGLVHPKLHRLSGSNWGQMTKKIKEETRAIAEELLKLYAQRETVEPITFTPPTAAEEELAATFPYDETPDQKKAIEEIDRDFRGERPMDRLICGDVGFGKTEVAIRAAFKAVANGKQVAVLSPTTILSQQHYDTFRERLDRFKVRIDQLSRFRSPRQQKETLAKAKLGTVDILIGTHRLLQTDVQFKDLGLVIIDEEQRFGVGHKERLKQLRLSSHVLTLTATPIPRTLNLALSGIRDITVIETPPEGRKPIETHIESYHDNIVQRACQREFDRGGQVYFVYNNVQTIAQRRKELEFLLPKARIGIAHGQLDEEELVNVMAAFDKRELDILLCSTIIENGLDLPNVNTLIVDQATQFGLAQLYQLRGRIGRGTNQAYSYFLYHAKKLTPEARKRLQALLEARELGSGFQLALRDLEIRGTGSILGKKQHGHVSAVGLSLYARLLAETIQELREGKPAQEQRDILIDLPLEIRIPKDLEPNEQKRLSFYQKLALENTVESLEGRVSRLFRRKVLPEPVQNLVDVLKLKLLGQPIGVNRISLTRSLSTELPASRRLTVDFLDPLIPGQIKALIDANPEWLFGENSIKIPIGALGERWMAALHTTFVALEKAKNVHLRPEEAQGK